ncbi:chloride channel protein [Acidiferrobacter sp.]|uniref:chloride channel protein n=1 Tax=Acidiferrobacter sp. TaxID=1872107 RepID=UPI0026099FD4|nr:chloride channel protein [Acidiferrobacter sp.]
MAVPLWSSRPLRRLRALVRGRHWAPRMVFWGGAVLVGLSAVALTQLGNLANARFSALYHHWPWAPFLVSPAGLILSLWLTRRFFPGAQGSGIPQVIAALSERPGRARARLLSVRIAIGKILLTTLGLFSGASIGREGPTAHVGASCTAAAGRLAGINRPELERALIIAGGGAGIAAAFNTPIAGIMFAIEELARGFDERASGTIIVTILLAGLTAVALEGNYTYFGVTRAALHPAQWPLVPACGLIGGLAGGLFSRLVLDLSLRLRGTLARHPYRLAGAVGLVIATLGVLSHGDSFGTGYPQARALVMGGAGLSWYFPLTKWLASLASYVSGIPGGLFAPALATGAGLGADIGRLFSGAPLQAAVILGMVSYLAGTVQTPITAFVIVMEMTANNAMLFPLMAAAFIASLVSRLLCPEPIYQALAKRFVTPADRHGALVTNYNGPA